MILCQKFLHYPIDYFKIKIDVDNLIGKLSKYSIQNYELFYTHDAYDMYIEFYKFFKF